MKTPKARTWIYRLIPLALLMGAGALPLRASIGIPEVETHVQAGRWPEALAEVDALRQSDPAAYRRDRLYLLQAWLHESSGQRAEAIALHAAWIPRDPLFTDYMLMEQARLQDAAGAPVAARKNWYALVKSHPKSPYTPDAHFLLAASYRDSGKLGLALQTFQNCAHKYKPRRDEARLAAAGIHARLKQWDAAWGLLWPALASGRARTEAAAALGLLDSEPLMNRVRQSEDRLARLTAVLVQNREARRALPLAEELRQRFPQSAKRPLYTFWVGRCRFLQGDYAAAAQFYAEAGRTDGEDLQVQSRLALGRTLLLAGREAEALPVYAGALELADDEATRSDIYAALYNVTRLTGPSAAPLGWLQRAAADLSERERRRFAYREALFHLRLGMPKQAVPILEALLPRLPSPAAGNLPDRLEARFFLGLAHEGAGDPQRAVETWTTELYHRHSQYAFLSMERAEAVLAGRPELRTTLAAAARTRAADLAAQGDQTTAYEEYGRLYFLTGDPDAWRQGIQQLPRYREVIAELADIPSLPVDAMAPPAASAVDTPAGRLFRARTFQRLGLAEPAALEYSRTPLAFVARHTGDSERDLSIRRAVTLARLFERAGAPHQAYRWSYLALERYPDGTPLAMINPELLRLSYPAPYQEDVRAANRDAGVDPYLIYSIIHQESRFNPRAHSPVSARGLMQLMPDTARAVAARSGIELPDTGAALYQPGLNIRLGVRYLRELLDRLQSPAASAAAYNAGLGQAAYWTRLAGQPADLYLPPEIHFHQTRGYVNHVMANMRLYRLVHPELARLAEPAAAGR
ncbi:MAG TPA: transglycosylase SLT domain-containing protein [Acidobacteriota bacterium]|nr:transglycosylase SLT domain-containing protein [Acidobacteriota bacterium]